jgi:hypothetical protein
LVIFSVKKPRKTDLGYLKEALIWNLPRYRAPVMISS